MNAPLYTTEIMRLASSLQEARTLEREDGIAELRSPTCGSHIRTVVQLDDDGRILALSQQVQACAFGQASAALLEQNVVGRTSVEIAEALAALTAWLAGEVEQGTAWLPLEPLAPARRRSGRHGAILLPLRALAAALDHAK